MPLTILSDKDVTRILHSLSKADVEHFQQILGDALHWYSTSNDANDCCSDFQPERTHLQRKDGSTTLFMPASGLTSQGVKVVNIAAPDTSSLPRLTESLTLSSQSSRTSSSLATPSPRNSIAASSTDVSSIADSSSSSLPRTLVGSQSDANAGPPSQSSSGSTIRGSITLFDHLGNTIGLLNAEEVTAFRTALASTMLLKKRDSVHDVTVFGSGKQAYWHTRLALLLRGSEIHHLNIINRSFDSARNCILRLFNPFPDDPDYENLIGERYNSRLRTAILTPSHREYDRLLKDYVRSSNVIFCTTPSTTPLFPATFLTNPEGRKKGRYIACIGSYKPHMVELHPDVLRYAVAPHHEHRHLHKRQQEGGAVIVDSVSACLKEAGEVLQAQLTPDQVVELGELFMLKREAERTMQQGGKQVEAGCNFQDQDDAGLQAWLSRGNVIYKSVGLGLMDVVVGTELLRLARERGIGVTIDHF